MRILPYEFKIKTDRITPFETEISKDLSSRMIGEADLKFKDPITVTVTARKIDHDIIVQGNIQAVALLTCARCLENFEYIIEKKNYFSYFKNPKDENIDLTPSLREDIIVSLPIKALCRDQCKGLCAKCGQNLNEKICGCLKDSGFNIHFMDLDNIIDIKDKDKKE